MQKTVGKRAFGSDNPTVKLSEFSLLKCLFVYGIKLPRTNVNFFYCSSAELTKFFSQCFYGSTAVGAIHPESGCSVMKPVSVLNIHQPNLVDCLHSVLSAAEGHLIVHIGNIRKVTDGRLKKYRYRCTVFYIAGNLNIVNIDILIMLCICNR